MAGTVLASDLHVSELIWLKYPNIRDDAFYALEQIEHICVRLAADELVLAGDIFDVADPPAECVQRLLAMLMRLSGDGCRSYYIQGDHDSYGRTPHLGVVDGLTLDGWVGPDHAHRSVLTLRSGAAVVGLDFTRPFELEAALADLPKADILLCHQRWAEFMGDITVPHGRLADLPYANVWTGDLHYHRDLRLEDKTVLSPGATHLRDIQEPPEHYVYYVREDLSYESVPLKSRPIYSVSIDSEDDIDKLVAEQSYFFPTSGSLPPDIARPVVRVCYPAGLPRCAARLQEGLADVHLMLRPVTVAAQPLASAPRAVRRETALVDAQAVVDESVPAESGLQDALKGLLAAQQQGKESLASYKRRFLEARRRVHAGLPEETS